MLGPWTRIDLKPHVLRVRGKAGDMQPAWVTLKWPNALGESASQVGLGTELRLDTGTEAKTYMVSDIDGDRLYLTEVGVIDCESSPTE